MPIVQDLSQAVDAIGLQPTVDAIPTNTNLNYMPNYVSSDTVALDKLASYIGGMAWYVDVYQQVITRDTQLSGQQITLNGVAQQYVLIKNLKIKVSSALEHSQDTSTKQNTYQGSGVVFNYVPNEGDLIVAKISENETAIFHISQTAEKSVYLQTAYEISYQLDTTDPEYLHDLHNKVIKTLIYVDEVPGKGSLITDEEYQILNSLRRVIKAEFNKYINAIYDRDMNAFLMYEQSEKIYDYYLSRFLVTGFEINTHPYLNKALQFEITSDVSSYNTVFEAILRKDVSLIDVVNVGIMDTMRINSSNSNVFGGSIELSGIPFCVYPLSINKRNKTISTKLSSFANDVSFSDDGGPNPNITFNSNLSKLQSLVFNAPSPRSAYVLSTAFYQGDTANYTLMDNLVVSYINGSAIDSAAMLKLINSNRSWTDLSYFYYMPIILFIAKSIYKDILI